MSGRYRLMAIVLVALAVVAVLATGQLSRQPNKQAANAAPVGAVMAGHDAVAANEECCTLPESQKDRTDVAPPQIPATKGRPCLVEFGSDECGACKRMKAVLDELEGRLAGKLDVVRVDTDDFPQQAQRWGLRVIPTLVILDASGREVARHEGEMALEQLLKTLQFHGIGV